MGKQIVSLIDVRQFGAQGDGVNDDAPAFAAAMQALIDFQGGKGASVGLPPGRYRFASAVAIPLVAGGSVTFEGTGDDAVIVLGPSPSTANFTGFTVADGATAWFQNLRFEGPSAGAHTVLAVQKLGSTGDVGFINVTALNVARAGVSIPTGCRLVLGDCAQVGNDYAARQSTATMTYLGDGLWGGTASTQPQTIKGFVDPSAGAGVAAPEGSYYQRYQAGVGEMWLKAAAADTGWLQLLAGGGGGVTLDGAYDFGGAGVGRTIAADAGAVVITSFGIADNNNVLEVSKFPPGAQSGDAISIQMGNNATGAGLSISHLGTGRGLSVAAANTRVAAVYIAAEVRSIHAVAPANVANLTASTSFSDVELDLSRTMTWATGALASQYAVSILPPTLAFAAASVVTTAATVRISGAPLTGANATITNKYGVLINSANVDELSLAVISTQVQTASHVVVTNSTTGATGALLALTKSPGGATAGDLMTITAGANCSGDALQITHAGSGLGIDVTGNGRITGNFEITGKLTVGGAIDPTSITFVDGGNAAYIESAAGQTAAVSPANRGRLRYNQTSQVWQMSANGAAYTTLGGTLDQAYDFGGAAAGRQINVDASAPVLLKQAVASLSDNTVVALRLESEDYAGSVTFGPILQFMGAIAGPSFRGAAMQARNSGAIMDFYIGKSLGTTPFNETLLRYNDGSALWDFGAKSILSTGVSGIKGVFCEASNPGSGFQGTSSAELVITSRATGGINGVCISTPNGISNDQAILYGLDGGSQIPFEFRRNGVWVLRDILGASIPTVPSSSQGGFFYENLAGTKRIQMATNGQTWADIVDGFTLYKTADQSVSSGGTGTTLANVTEMVFNIGINEKWEATFELDIGDALATTGIKTAVTTPASCVQTITTAIVADAIDIAGAGRYYKRTTSSGTAMDFTIGELVAAGLGKVWVHIGLENAGTAGAVQLQFAQSTSSATNLTLKKFSVVRARRLRA